MKKRHRLRLVGITYNQIESGVYALILEEVNGRRRIPIVIGYPEAQSIECKLQDIRTPRPLTHDLMKHIMDVFGLTLSCVDIRKLPTGVFAADLLMEGPDGELHKIDARSSDAIALAIRADAPIYTSAEVLDESGFLPREAVSEETQRIADEFSRMISDDPQDTRRRPGRIESFESLENMIGDDEGETEDVDAEILEFLGNFSDKEIEAQISKFAAEEKYEVAARLKNLLNKRRNPH